MCVLTPGRVPSKGASMVFVVAENFAGNLWEKPQGLEPRRDLRMSDLQRPVQMVLNGVTQIYIAMAAATPVSKPVSNTGWSQDTEMPAASPAVLVLIL